jgi:hypothetical protein
VDQRPHGQGPFTSVRHVRSAGLVAARMRRMAAHHGTHDRSLVTFAGLGGVLGGWVVGAVVRRFSM